MVIPLPREPDAVEALIPILAEVKSGNAGILSERVTTEAAKIVLRKGFGLGDHQFVSQYKCDGISTVDFAVSYVNNDFSVTRGHPQILLELKKPGKKFTFGTKGYFEVVDQLKRYMNARSCETVEHGIIFNACQVQIFRKHCKLIYPVTDVIDLIALLDKEDNLRETIQYLKEVVIDQPRHDKRLRRTIITIWNNKGGVGKTTTAFHLSLLLSDSRICPGSQNSQKAKVLAIDFDHDQANLTEKFKSSRSNGETLALFKNNDSVNQFQLQEAIKSFPIEEQQVVVYLLAADQYLCDSRSVEDISEYNKDDTNLRRLCLRLAKTYDYIIIDAPPNYQRNVYAREAINAADCLLPIAQWNDQDSLSNYYSAVCNFLPISRSMRRDGGPENLGLWINKWERNYAIYNKMIKAIKKCVDKAENKDNQEQLRRAFGFEKEEKLRLIKEVADIRKIADIGSEASPFRVPWLKRPQAAYQPLLQSIV